MHPVSRGAVGSCDEVGSCQVVPRHIRMTAYRCYLPVLTGFTGSYCEGPGHQHHFPPPISRRHRSLDREFDPAIADCGCRAPLPPRLARSRRNIGGDERIRTADPLVANEVLSQLSYIPTPISHVSVIFPEAVYCFWRRERDSNPRSSNLLNGFRDRPIQPALASLRSLALCLSVRAGDAHSPHNNMDVCPVSSLTSLAEREGFEPSVGLRPTHDFQSCRFSQLSHLSAPSHPNASL